ncbi:MAG: hypothetical protein SW833_05180 [Cyanobacteriota bacterium]|nr:hypothetical protein [Cyanobacteriota bacterium]
MTEGTLAIAVSVDLSPIVDCTSFARPSARAVSRCGRFSGEGGAIAGAMANWLKLVDPQGKREIPSNLGAKA